MTREMKAKGADMETQGRITAAEIRARVRGRLEGEARAEAKHKALERARVSSARWRGIAAKHEAMGDTAAAAHFRAVADAEERGGQETDGAEASRKAGFVGNALARAAGVRLVDVAATLAGWSAERVRNVALEAVADMGEDAPEFAIEAATAAWWEARARVAVRGYMRSVGAEMFGANFHDGGERRACATSPDEYARRVQMECTRFLLVETENIFLSMTANQERNHAEAMQEIAAVKRLEKEAHDAFRRGENEIERALTVPAEMAAELLEFARKEMTSKAAVLWGAYVKHGYSLHAASKDLGKGFGWGTANRLYHAELVPFMERHGLTVKAEGRHTVLAYNGKTDAHLSRPSGYHGPHKLDDGEDGGD